MKPSIAHLAALAAITSLPQERSVQEIKPSRLVTWDLHPPFFTNSPQSSGMPFYGRTKGTRKAMKQAAKRRRILARLPK